MQAPKPTVFFDSTLLRGLNPSVRKSPIDKLHLSTRAHNSLVGLGINLIGELVDIARCGIPSPRASGRKTAANMAGALHALAESVMLGGEVDWIRYDMRRERNLKRLDTLLLQSKPAHPEGLYFSSPALDGLDAAVRRRSLKTLHLRPRALHALEAAGINSIRKLITASRRGIGDLHAAGQQTWAELREALVSLSKAARPDGDIDWLAYAGLRNFHLLPEKDDAGLPPSDFGRVFSGAVGAAVESRFGEQGRVLFEQYFLRKDSDAPSFRRMARTLGLTAQGIALRKDRIVRMLQGALLEDDYSGCHFRFRDALAVPLQRLKARLDWMGNSAVRRSEWKQAVTETLAINAADLEVLEHLFRAILGLEVVHRSARRFEPIILPKIKGTSAFGAAQKKIETLLRAQFPRGLSKIQILEQLQLSGSTDITLKEVSTLVHSIAGIECSGREEWFRVSIDRLARLADQLERILDERGSPLNKEELAREIGRFKGRVGSKRSPLHIASAMSRDNRFKAIGRTGMWVLAPWDVETGAIADVAARCLRLSGGPLTEAELFALIAARRPVKMNSIMSSLREDGRFRRVAPRTWELK